MPAKSPKVARTRYICPKTGKPKFLQTLVSLHGSHAEAKAWLAKRKALILSGKGDESKECDKPNTDSVDVESNKDSDTRSVEHKEIEDGNLMNASNESTPLIDKIYSELKFSRFYLDMDITKTGYSVTIFGSSKSGKTYLLERLLKQYVSKKKNSICVLSAQNIHNNIYKDYPNDIILTDQYSPIILKAAARVNKRLKNKYSFVFVLDDIIDQKNDGRLESAYLTLRNCGISIITLLQNVQLMKSTSRSNSNIIIFKKFNNAFTIQEYVMKQYIGTYSPFKDLPMADKVALYIKITNNDYNFFVLDVLNNTLILCKGTDL